MSITTGNDLLAFLTMYQTRVTLDKLAAKYS